MPTYTTNYNIPKPLVNDPQDEDLWGDYLNDGMDIIDATMASISGGGGGGTPSGTVADYAGASAPSGWQLCYGQAINRVTYAALFTAIGTAYGAGDGSTTFNLPDCRGRVVAGKDDMGGTSANRLTNQTGGLNGDTLGATGGAETHVLTEAQLASHTHTGSTDTAGAHTHNISNGFSISGGGGGSYQQGVNNGAALLPPSTDSSGSHSHTITMNNTGSNEAHNNVQPTIIFNKIIKE